MCVQGAQEQRSEHLNAEEESIEIMSQPRYSQPHREKPEYHRLEKRSLAGRLVEPTTVDVALSGQDSGRWMAAINEELGSLR